MPEELNEGMDKTLRDYARERRGAMGADPSLSEFNRRELHKEVEHVYGTKRRPEPEMRVPTRRWWPRIALATGCCAVALIALFSLRTRSDRTNRESKTMSLAALDKSTVLDKARPNNAPTADATIADQSQTLITQAFTRSESTAIPMVRDTNIEEKRESFAQSSIQPTVAGGTLTANAAGELPAPAQKLVAPAEAIQSEALQAHSETPTLISARAVAAPTAELSNLGDARRMTFQKWPSSPTPASESRGFTPLSDFQVEQIGTDLRLIDQDGSVYAGTLTLIDSNAVVLPPPSTAPTPTGAYSFAAPQNGNMQAGSIYLLHAQGTNLTLGKKVVLSADYFERTNLPPNVTAGTIVTPASRARRSIVGTATIGASNEVPVKAISTRP